MTELSGSPLERMARLDDTLERARQDDSLVVATYLRNKLMEWGVRLQDSDLVGLAESGDKDSMVDALKELNGYFTGIAIRHAEQESSGEV